VSAGQRNPGQTLAGAGGILLFGFLFLPWFGVEGVNLSGWEGQSSTDVYLLITALVAIGAALAGRGEIMPGLSMSGAAAVLGGVGTIVLLWLVIFDFPDGADRKIGLYLSLVAVIVIAFGGYSASQLAARRSARSDRY
jgi:multidrug transporter EmrE-like cation transporter